MENAQKSNVIFAISKSLNELYGILKYYAQQFPDDVPENFSQVDSSQSTCEDSAAIRNRVGTLLDRLKTDFNRIYSQEHPCDNNFQGDSGKTRFRRNKFQKPTRVKLKRRHRRASTGLNENTNVSGSCGGQSVALVRNGDSCTWHSLDHAYEWTCSIDDYRTSRINNDKYTEFKITTVMPKELYDELVRSRRWPMFAEVDLPAENEGHLEVYRRFNDFKRLFKTLVSAHPYLCIPPLPPDRIAKLDSEVVRYRMVRLELWLCYLAVHPILSRSNYILDFLRDNGKQYDICMANVPIEVVSLSTCVRDLGALPIAIKRERMGQLKGKAKELVNAVADIHKLLEAEKNLISRDYSDIYARLCAKLKKIPPLLGANTQRLPVQNLDVVFYNAASIFNKRAYSLYRSAKRFDDIMSIFEEFSNIVEQLEKLVTVGDAYGYACVEAEFNWILNNQMERLVLELSDFYYARAELLEKDAQHSHKTAKAFGSRLETNSSLYFTG